MRIRLKRWQIWSLILIIGIFLYQISSYFFLYCNDAYVDADFVVISPQVSGTVAEVPVSDNQLVHKGDVLLKLDPTPFALAFAQTEAQYRQAQAQLKSQQDQQAIAMQKAAVASSKSAMDLASYNLSLTTITAPNDGYINNLRIRPGNYVTQNTALFGLVVAHSWYIVANYPERALSHIHPGQTVWIMLSSNWGHIYRGTVESYGRAIARDSSPDDAALPYIKPTTDWIRYPYRFPVTIRITDLPADVPIGKGADARTLIFVK